MFRTPQPGERWGVRVKLFVALDRLERRSEIWAGRSSGIVLDVVTETYDRQRRRWSLERNALAAELPAKGILHQEHDVPLVLVYRHKQFTCTEPVLMPWRVAEDGTTEGARGMSSGFLTTGEVLARATGEWPRFAGQLFDVYDQPAYDGPKWTPITDPTG